MDLQHGLQPEKKQQMARRINFSERKTMNVYCALARNSMPWIPNNLYTILSLKKPEDKIIIVENNSTDQTRVFLEDLKKSRPDELIILGEDDKTPEKYPQKPLKERAEYLAKLRNIYLDYVQKNFDEVVDRLIVFDSDLHQISRDNFDKLFTDNAATCANGLNVIQIGNINHVVYYDTWAYLSMHEDFVHGIKRPVPFMRPPGLVEVRSAFGGVAVYKWEAVKNCRYGFFDLNKLHTNGKPMTLGEHGKFNEDIRKNGGKVVIQTEYFCFSLKFPL